MEGGPFATICNLFSKIYFVTIYLSLKKENCTPHLKKLFSKYVVSVIVSEGVNIQGKLGQSRAQEGASTAMSVLQGEEWGCRPGQAPSQSPLAVGPPQCLASLGGGLEGQRQ